MNSKIFRKVVYGLSILFIILSIIIAILTGDIKTVGTYLSMKILYWTAFIGLFAPNIILSILNLRRKCKIRLK